jgi:hypothetical protein
MKANGGEDSSADEADGKKKDKNWRHPTATVAMVSRTVYSVNYEAIQEVNHRSGRVRWILTPTAAWLEVIAWS